jgi:hypothetical protein
MAAGIGSRFAGKALNDFLKVVTTLGSTAVEQAVLNKLTTKYSPTVEKYAVYPPRTGAEIIKNLLNQRIAYTKIKMRPQAPELVNLLTKLEQKILPTLLEP